MAQDGANPAKTSQQERAELTLAALKKRYPEIGTQLVFHSPWELLVAVVLAAQCTDARVNEATPEFFRRWPGPCDLAAAKQEEVEQVIMVCGFYHNKARHLLETANIVCHQYKGELPRTMEELIKLPGVARKTANCVLYAGFGVNEGLAVDTHVKRISYRLGLTENTEPNKIEKDLMEIFPRKEWGDLNHRLVEFGRDVCKARKPACASCEMAHFCPRNPPLTSA